MGIDGEKYDEKINWHDSYDELIKEKHCFLESRRSDGDMFYKMFLNDSCLGKQCYKHCKYKYDKSSADIRIGDLWGKIYSSDEDGVSCAIAFTSKGNYVLKHSNCEMTAYMFDVVAEGQMKDMPLYHWYFYITRVLLKICGLKLHHIIRFQKYLIKINNHLWKF